MSEKSHAPESQSKPPEVGEQSKRDKLLDLLHRKVIFVRDFLNRIDETESPESLLLTHLPDDNVEAEKKYDSLVNEHFLLLDNEKLDPEVLMNMTESVCDQMDTLEREYPYIGFIRAMRNVKENIEKKKARVQSIPDDIESVVGEFQVSIPELAAQDIARVVRRPFSISLILHPDSFQRLFENNGSGMHFGGTPFNVVKDKTDTYAVEQTIEHEDVHNLTDGVITTLNPAVRLEREMKRVISMQELNLFMPLDKYLSNANRYLDDMHGEFLAGFAQEEETGFQGTMPDQWFGAHGMALRTAGSDLKKMINVSIPDRKRLAQQEGDTELENFLDDLLEDLSAGFRNIHHHMRESALVAGMIGQEASDQVEILFALLKPSQYHHLQTYLETFFNEQVVKDGRRVYKLLRFFSLNELRDGVEALEGFEGDFSDAMRGMIRSKLRGLPERTYGKSSRMGLLDLVAVREYIDLLKRLNTFLTMDGEENHDVDRLVYAMQLAFFTDSFASGLKNGWKDLRAIREQCTQEEGDFFDRSLRDYIKDCLVEDIDSQGIIGKDGWNERVLDLIEGLPLWDGVKEFGLEDYVREVLKKYDDEAS